VMSYILKKYTGNAKKLIVATSKQAEIEKQQLLKKLMDFGLLPQSAKLEDVLGLTLKDILNRRIQTVVFKQGLTRSVKQSRQFITHEHLFVGENKITSPSYLVRVSEESLIHFDNASSLNSIEHPERVILEKKEPKKRKPKKDVRRGRGRGNFSNKGGRK
ncbi:30S ribosomal protein S4, partial [Nanoarchaeota archaeon]